MECLEYNAMVQLSSPAGTSCITSEVEDAVEELVGHQRMGELPEEGLQQDGGGVDVLLLKADRLSPVNFLDEFLDGGGTG